jgi:hypothetical protein
MNCPYCGGILSEIPSLKENTISLICKNINCPFPYLPEKKFEVNISRLIYNIWNEATELIINNIKLPENNENNEEIKNFIKALLEKDNTNIDLENIIKNNKLNKNLIGLWLFSYNEFTDTIETLDIFYPPLELKSNKAEEIKKRIEKVRIKGGQGTVGFIQRSGEPEILNNTQEDPRATVAVEDFLIRDFSWVGIPVPLPEIKNNEIKSSERDTKLIVSFFVPYFNAWKNNREEVKKSLIENLRKYEGQLLLYKEKKNYENLLNCIVKSGRLKEGNISSETDLSGIYTEILKRIVEVSYLTFPIRYILFLTKDTSEEEFSVESLYLDFKNLSIDLHKKINLCYLQGKQHPCDKDCIANNLWKLFEECVQETIDIDDGKKEGGGFHFEFLLSPKDTQKINNNKNELLKPMKDYFELFIKIYNEKQIEFEKKKIEDVITNLAHNIIDFLFSKIEKEDFEKELEILEKAVFPKNDDKQNERKQLIENVVKIKELFKDAFLCLFYKDVPYKISLINDNYKEELKEPATINVICKAIESKEGGIFERYKTLLQAKENKKLSMQGGEIKIGEIKINEEKLLAFSNDKGEKYLKYLGLNNLAIGEFIYKNFGRGEKIKIKEKEEEKLIGAQIDNNNLINKLEKIFIGEKEKDFYIYSTSISNKKITLLLRTTKEIEENLKNTIEEYIEGLIDELIEKIQQIEITKHALRSAVAAIMSRNMSHNIGSHVLNYLSNPEELNNLWII